MPDSDLIKNMVAARLVTIVAQLEVQLKFAYEEGYRDGGRDERRFIRSRLSDLMAKATGVLSLDHVTELLRLLDDEE